MSNQHCLELDWNTAVLLTSRLSSVHNKWACTAYVTLLQTVNLRYIYLTRPCERAMSAHHLLCECVALRRLCVVFYVFLSLCLSRLLHVLSNCTCACDCVRTYKLGGPKTKDKDTQMFTESHIKEELASLICPFLFAHTDSVPSHPFDRPI